MLRIIEGKIGSGKTYYAVYHILKNYYEYDKDFKEYVKRNDSIRIITNIKDLKLQHESLEELIDRVGGMNIFFTSSHQKTLGNSIVYLIDEAQGYFDRKYYNKDVFFYLQTHRHLGHDIYLITQDAESLSKEVRLLAEYSIVPAERSLRIFNEFRYVIRIGTENYKRIVLKQNKDVFRLYKSHDAFETERPKRFALKYFAYFGVLALVVFIVSRLFFGSFFDRGSKDVKLKPNNALIQKQIDSQREEILKRVEQSKFGNKKKEQEGSDESIVDSSEYMMVGFFNGVPVYQKGNSWRLYVKSDDGYVYAVNDMPNSPDAVVKTSDVLRSYEKVLSYYFKDNDPFNDFAKTFSKESGADSSSVALPSPFKSPASVSVPSSNINPPQSIPSKPGGSAVSLGAKSPVVSPKHSVFGKR